MLMVTAGFDEEEPSFPAANVAAVQAIAGALATTLGPTPRDKLVVRPAVSGPDTALPGVEPTGDLHLTGDGATLLDALDLDHPIAPVVRRLAGPDRPGETDVEGRDIPDGVTSTIVLTAALLDEATSLLELGLHPTTVRTGYRLAQETALDTLATVARPLDSFEDPRGARLAVAWSAMTGNDVGGHADRWTEMAVSAAGTVGTPDEDTFVVRTVRAGSVDDSTLVRGAVLDRSERASEWMPGRVTDARVLVLDGDREGGLRAPDYGDRYTATADAPGALAGFEDPDAARRERVLAGLADLDVTAVVCRHGIEPPYRRALAARGVFGVAGVTPRDLAQVALATGATPVLHVEDVEESDLGRAGVVEERATDRVAGERTRRRRMVVVDDCPEPGSVSALVRGVWPQLGAALATDLRKATAAVVAAERSGAVPGGGATDLQIEQAVRAAAPAVSSREQLAVEAFADATSFLVGALVTNAGRDRLSTLADLRAAHDRGETTTGLVHAGRDTPSTSLADALAAGVLDPLDVRRRVYVAAVEVATLILRVDGALDATSGTETPDPGDAIYEEPAEQQQDYLAEQGSR